MVKVSSLAFGLVAMTALAIAAQTQNQPPGISLIGKGVLGTGIEPALYPKPLLLQRWEIQKELKLTESQNAQYAKLQKEEQQFLERIEQETEKKRQELDPEGFKAYRGNIYPSLAPHREETEAKLLKILEPDQRRRLDQIQIQAEGPMAFSRADIQKRLNLSPDQIEAIMEIVAQGRENLETASRVGSDVYRPRQTGEESTALKQSKAFRTEVSKTRGGMVKVRLATMQAIAKLLTKKQRGTYEAMVGEPVDFLKMQADREKASESQQQTKAP